VQNFSSVGTSELGLCAMNVAAGGSHSAAELCWRGDGRREPLPKWSPVLGSGLTLY